MNRVPRVQQPAKKRNTLQVANYSQPVFSCSLGLTTCRAPRVQAIAVVGIVVRPGQVSLAEVSIS